MSVEKVSTRMIEVRTYLTMRGDLPESLRNALPLQPWYECRACAVVDGVMEWKYFESVQHANLWLDGFHAPAMEAPRPMTPARRPEEEPETNL